MIWDWKRCLLHIPVGIIAALLLLVHPYGWALCLAFILLFIFYERNEDGHLDDEAYIDVQGAMVGLPIGGVIIYLIERLT